MARCGQLRSRMLHAIVTDCNLQDFCTEIGQMLTELWGTVSDKHSVRAARHPLAQRYSPSPSSTTSSDPALHSPDTGAASHLLPRLSLQGASWGRTTILGWCGVRAGLECMGEFFGTAIAFSTKLPNIFSTERKIISSHCYVLKYFSAPVETLKIVSAPSQLHS